jgi:spermidine synthase
MGKMFYGKQTSKTWYTDYITENEKHQHRVKKWIIQKKTRHQNIAIAELASFGKCLIIDDDLQSASGDEFIYHEALVHPAMALHGKPESVLILGGGEGATLREVLKYKTVKKAIMVDIDSSVIDFCREHMPGYSKGSFDDKRSKIVIEDARKYIKEADEKYDVIISDLSSPVAGGPAYTLYTQEFYKGLIKRLLPGGIFSAQVDSLAVTNIDVPASIRKTLRRVFSQVQMYGTYIPSFDSLWGFIVASPQTIRNAGREEIDLRLKKIVKGGLLFYDGMAHEGMFGLPKYIRDNLETKGTVITEKNPVFIYK